MRIIKSTALILISVCIQLQAQSPIDTLPVAQLKKLSIEELMNISIEVISVSGKSEKLTQVASAIQVISGNEIRRSGVTRLPEALRLASNLQVAQTNSNSWSITSRGFSGLPSANGILSNKLLVMVDGRSIYTPLFGGVLWDAQNTVLEDLDRIEVVSGPGGTLWGANAVNGVINIVTKSSKETQGLYVSGLSGSFTQDIGEIRYGFKLDSNLYARVFGQRYDQEETFTEKGFSNKDAWNMTRGGFRMDYYPSKYNTFMLQGNFYGAVIGDSVKRNNLDGQNGLLLYTHHFADTSELKVQFYYDRTWRKTPNSVNPFFHELNTFDIDIQHGFNLSKRQELRWGVGYRYMKDHTARVFDPLSREMPVYSGFIQDEIAIVPEKLRFTIGSKFLHNVFTGFEFQPCVRLAWTPDTSNTIWTSVSKAVRTPSRFDADVTPSLVKFNSEKVIAYELGYRVKISQDLFCSFSTFFNQYTSLRSIDSNSVATPALILTNNQKGNSMGFEFHSTYQAAKWWRLRAGYSYFYKKIEATSDRVLPASAEFEGIDPAHQARLQSMMDLTKNFQFDLTSRFVSVISAGTVTNRVPEYFTFDLRLAYTIKAFEFSVVGQNLTMENHLETGTTRIPRSVYGRIVCRL
jgi:iron complex outermembrane recepter protein